MLRSDDTSITVRTTSLQLKIPFHKKAVFVRNQRQRPPESMEFPFECEGLNEEGEIIAFLSDDMSWEVAAQSLFQMIEENGGNPQWVQ